MSSVVGVKITNVDPVNKKTLRITLKELNMESDGINQKISVSVGSNNLVGSGIIDGRWTGSTTIHVPLKAIRQIYTHESMHVHIFPVTC